MERNIEGFANLPEHGKFQVFLECGHKIIADHSVDSIGNYSESIVCYQCLPTIDLSDL